MVERKKAMHSETRHAERITISEPNIVTVVEGMTTRYETTLTEILKKAELSSEFIPPVNPEFAAKEMDNYYGREIYITEDNKGTEKPTFHHGKLETDVLKSRAYAIRLENAPNMPDIHYFSRIRKMIVIRKWFLIQKLIA